VEEAAEIHERENRTQEPKNETKIAEVANTSRDSNSDSEASKFDFSTFNKTLSREGI
jgi:hypothetical protein